MAKKKIFRVLFFLLFLFFLIGYIIERTGYYEYKLQNRTIMTNEAINRFEEDVREGKNVSIEDYVVDTEKDYTSTLTRNTNRVSMKVNVVLKKGIESVFKVLSSFAED